MRPEFETFLARLYTDAQLRARFLANPRAEAERHCMTVEESAALERIDRAGLELSARSFAHKRALKASSKRARSWLAGLAETVRRKVGLYPPAHLCWRLLPKPVVEKIAGPRWKGVAHTTQHK